MWRTLNISRSFAHSNSEQYIWRTSVVWLWQETWRVKWYADIRIINWKWLVWGKPVIRETAHPIPTRSLTSIWFGNVTHFAELLLRRIECIMSQSLISIRTQYLYHTGHAVATEHHTTSQTANLIELSLSQKHAQPSAVLGVIRSPVRSLSLCPRARNETRGVKTEINITYYHTDIHTRTLRKFV